MTKELSDIRPPIVEDLQPASIHGYEEQKWHGAGGGLTPDWDI